jgi:hypothetical protein
MFTDETQEDTTLQNSVEPEEETVTETPAQEPKVTDWEAEAKKWEAIAKRKAKQAAEATPAPAVSMDQELVQITYRNHLSSLGISTQEAQDKAFEYAKKTGQPLTQLVTDPAIMEVLKAANKAAITKQAIAPGTGGAAVHRNDTGRLASAISQGKSVKDDDISGEQALELLGLKR